MVTADNITDEQICDLRDSAPYDSETYRVCVRALEALDAISEPARARCAEILNERTARNSEVK